MSLKWRCEKGVEGMIESINEHEAGQETAERWSPHAMGVPSTIVDSRKYFVSGSA